MGNENFRLRPTCELCGSTSKVIVLTREFHDPAVMDFLDSYYRGAVDKTILKDAQFEIVRCVECGFLWQHQILRDHGLDALYSQWISSSLSQEKQTTGELGKFVAHAREILRVARYVNHPPHKIRVLDHGMGWGHWCRMATAFGMQAYGTELSVDRQRYAESFGVKVSALQSLEAESFDFINSEQSFEHIPEPTKMLKLLVQTLKPGGWLRIAVPNAASALRSLRQDNWRASKDAFHPLEHINAFTRDSLMRLGREAGLELLVRRPFAVVAVHPWSAVLQALSSLMPVGSSTTVYFRKPS